MASTSDPLAAGGGEGSSVAAATAVAPPADPPPPSSSSSKRRWSPCTWRYAIEEVQPELGSRPRSSSNNPPYSSSSLRAAGAGSDHAPPHTTSKSRPLHTQDYAYGKESDEPVRRASVYGSRTWAGAELSELRARHAQPRSQADMLSKNKRPPHPQQSHQQHQQKEPAKRPKEEEEEYEDEDEHWDDDDDGDDDAEVGHHVEEGKKRKKREMSPSELYYCDICRAKSAESLKLNISPDSPLPLQDP